MKFSRFLTMRHIGCLLSLCTPFVLADVNTAATLAPGELPPPQIAVSPANLNLDLNDGVDTGAVRVFNLGKEVIKVKTAVNHFDLDDDNKVRIIAPTPQSLDQWLVVNPLTFEIAPGDQQVVRFAVRPTTEPLAGEHRAMVFFEQIPDQNTSNSNVQVTFRLGVALYALAGNIVRKGVLHGVDLDHQTTRTMLKFDIQSDGNAVVRMAGQFSVWPKSRFPGVDNLRRYNLTETHGDVPEEAVAVGNLPNTPVLPGERRTIVTNVNAPVAAGDYVIGVHGKLGDESFAHVLPLTISN